MSNLSKEIGECEVRKSSRKGVRVRGGLELAGANQPVHWFLGDKGLSIQQGTIVWVVSSKSLELGGVTEVIHRISKHE